MSSYRPFKSLQPSLKGSVYFSPLCVWLQQHTAGVRWWNLRGVKMHTHDSSFKYYTHMQIYMVENEA